MNGAPSRLIYILQSITDKSWKKSKVCEAVMKKTKSVQRKLIVSITMKDYSKVSSKKASTMCLPSLTLDWSGLKLWRTFTIKGKSDFHSFCVFVTVKFRFFNVASFENFVIDIWKFANISCF